MAKLVEVQKKICTELNLKFQDTTQQILIENVTDQGFSGRSRLDKLVYVNGDNISIGDFVEVKIVETRTWSLTGEVQNFLNNESQGQLVEY